MNTADYIVNVLLEAEGDDEAEDFMRNVGFDATRRGEMYTLPDLNLIEDELEQLKSAVIRRTGEILPKLVELGIVREDQSQILAKLVTYYLAAQQYDPKHWHENWQKAAKKIFRWIGSNASWSSTRSYLNQ